MTAWIVFLGLLGLGLGARALVRHTFEAASGIDAACACSGRDVAQLLASQYGVEIAVTEDDDDWLGDHFDPRSNRIVLSSEVGNEQSVGAIAVAAHEAGHAVQKVVRAPGYGLRAALAPVALVAEVGYMLLPLFAILLVPFGLGAIVVLIALVSLTAILVVELITLPVEIGASRRAMRMLDDFGLLQPEERRAARRVLTAAAMTYVAAALGTIVAILFWASDDD
jgi:Zn-dependent membrane protease YugP